MNSTNEAGGQQHRNPLEAVGPSVHGDAVSRRVLKGGVLTAGTKFAGIGAALVANVFLARAVTTDEFGVFLLLSTVISFGAIIGRAGLDRALVIYISKDIAVGRAGAAREAVRKGLRISEVASLVAAVAIFGLLYFGGRRLFDLPQSFGIAAAVAIGVLLTSRLNVVADSLCGYHDQLYRSLFESQSGGLLLNGVFVLLLVPCYMFGLLSLDIVMWVFVISVGVLLPLAAWRFNTVAGRHLDTAVNTGREPSELTYDTILTLCMPLMLSQLLIFVSTRADIWIAGACFTHGDLATFGAARRMTFLVSMPLTIVNLSVISSIPELYSEQRIAELQRILRVSGTLAAIPVAFVLLPIIFFPETILSVIYGGEYSGGASALVILCCGQLVATLTGSCGSCLMMTGHHKTMVVSSLAAVLFLFVAGIPAGLYFGAIGLSSVCALTMAGKNLWWLVETRIKIGVWTQVAIPDAMQFREILNRLMYRKPFRTEKTKE